MARLLIVSRSMALAMRLADEHEVTEHSADDVEALDPAMGMDVDVLILDIGDPVRSVDTVNNLREAGSAVPVLLVSGYQPEWEQVESQQVAGVCVVPLPITRGALLNGVRVLLAGDPLDLGPPASGDDEDSAGQTMPVATVSGPVATARPDDTVAIPTITDDTPDTPGEPAEESAEESVTVEDADTPDETDETDQPDEAVVEDEGDSEPIKASQPVETVETVDPAEDSPAAEAAHPDDTTGERTDDSTDEQDQPPTSQDIEPAAANGNGGSRNGHDAPRPGPEQTQRSLPPGLRNYEVDRHEEQPETGHQEAAEPPWHQVAAPAARQPGTGTWWSRDARPEPESPSPDMPEDVPTGPGGIPTGPNGVPTGSGGISLGNLRARIGDRQRKLRRTPSVTDTPAPGVGLITDPLGPRTDPHGMSTALDRRLDAEAGALLGNAVVRDTNGVALRLQDLIEVLNEHATSLYGVGDTAQVLADDAIEKADADAAAVLVPDGPSWRVSGGVGLRPLERRLVLQEEHWLVAEIALGGRAVLVEDTDVIRQQLSGAPLAAWRHLLAVPIPDIQGIVVLARGQEGGEFSDRELSMVIGPVREAAPLLGQAIEIRRLARLLGPLREMEWENPRRAD